MTGERHRDQPDLFFGFGLERHVPADHRRSIDGSVNLDSIGELLRPYY